MNFYQDITLLPDAEITLGFLWQKVYQQIHIALVENKIAENKSAIAVAFPKYGSKGFPLGNKLRLLADNDAQLETLAMEKWLSKLNDYCHIKSIKATPTEINIYACYKRKQFKSNLLKEAQRRAQYKNETLEEALTHFQHYETACDLPYINMTSLSMPETQNASNHFRLFIEQELHDKPREGQFNCYGLSKTATVPHFD